MSTTLSRPQPTRRIRARRPDVSPELAAAFDACADSVSRWRGADPEPVRPPFRWSAVFPVRMEHVLRLVWQLRWSRRQRFVLFRRALGVVALTAVVTVYAYLLTRVVT
jgi:hypothetical protein